LGLIGKGAIGTLVSTIAKAFGMNVLIYDPYLPRKQPENGMMVDLDELLKQSDIVSIHCPLTTETRHMINRDKFALMKKSAYLINTARGEIVNQNDLIDALKEQLIAGASLDVFENEPLNDKEPLFEFDNVVLTPHIAGQTIESRTRIITLLVDSLIAVLSGEIPKREILANPEVLRHSGF
jgi:glycerate dehydrogenase